jgi:hypothetical protein
VADAISRTKFKRITYLVTKFKRLCDAGFNALDRWSNNVDPAGKDKKTARRCRTVREPSPIPGASGPNAGGAVRRPGGTLEPISQTRLRSAAAAVPWRVVAPRSNTPGILAPRALRDVRRDALGATAGF